MTSHLLAESTPLQLPNDVAAARLTLPELDDAMQRVDPTALLILPRILRRVIKQDCGLAGFGLKVPHRKSYVIGRQRLLEIVDYSELGWTRDLPLPDRVILLARPSPRKLAVTPAGEALLDYWRLLFHARVHVAMEERIARGALPPAALRTRIHSLGTAQFEEIRSVLGQDAFLLPPRSDESVYVEFVAVYFELRHFAPDLLSHYFPSLENLEEVDALVGQEVNGDALFQATRPRGASDPIESRGKTRLTESPPKSRDGDMADATTPSELKYHWLMRKSQRPAALGNVVRAAIYRARAQRWAPPEFAERLHLAIKMDVYRLIRRLQAALDGGDTDAGAWEDVLLALVERTADGVWTAEARLLYDLQKACVDYEREIYTVDLIAWALAWGRRRIKRPLPNQRDVLMLKHLRGAARRLDAVRIADSQRQALARLIEVAVRRVAERLRSELRPKIVAALDTVGLIARNLPERVARKKLIEELLDQVGERGFLTMGDLRDAISRNNLKLPDLSEPRDFFRGDQLLQADRELARALDGVYRSGEFYVRWMQRISSLGFGTHTGRFLTRFAVVPFGGAYVVLVFVHHLLEWIGHSTRAPEALVRFARGAVEAVGRKHVPLLSAPVFVLGLFLLCLANSAAFRSAIAIGAKMLFQIMRAIVVEPIRWIIRSPWIQRIIRSRLFALLWRFIVKPLMWTAVVQLLIPGDEGNRTASFATAVSLFCAVNLLLNSRFGRNMEEAAIDWTVEGWHRFGLRFITGFFWLIVDLFKWLLETIDRFMYAVDEWLRFRSGEGRTSLVAKVAIGLVWRPAAYVLRFAVNVLLEPQLNPIKHFPVVTVGHKLLFGLYAPFAHLLEAQTAMSQFEAWAVAGTIIWCIPGAFGFLVWELTANWRLYAANRRPDLSPLGIGAHGETMARLLKPGFHSGTLPKRFAKLRRAERHARLDGGARAVRKQVQVLDRVETGIRRYVCREFIELLAQSRRWQADPPQLTSVRLGTNRIELAIGHPATADADLRIAFELESGWLVGGITNSGWVDRLLPHERQVLVTALIGLYKSAGVDLVRQQIEAQFPPPMPLYDIRPEGLVLWPEASDDVEVLYDVHDGSWIAPQSIRGLARRSLPTIERQQLVFGNVSVPWDRWVAVWNRDEAGQGHLPALLPTMRVLPS